MKRQPGPRPKTEDERALGGYADKKPKKPQAGPGDHLDVAGVDFVALRQPYQLRGVARWLWDRLAPELARLGRLDVTTCELFAEFCRLYRDWRLLHAEYERARRRRSIPAGQRQAMYYHAMTALKNWATFGQDYGLTPASVQKIAGPRARGLGAERVVPPPPPATTPPAPEGARVPNDPIQLLEYRQQQRRAAAADAS